MGRVSSPLESFSGAGGSDDIFSFGQEPTRVTASERIDRSEFNTYSGPSSGSLLPGEERISTNANDFFGSSGGGSGLDFDFGGDGYAAPEEVKNRAKEQVTASMEAFDFSGTNAAGSGG